MAARLRSALSSFEKSQKPPKGTLASGLLEAILGLSFDDYYGASSMFALPPVSLKN